MFRMSPGSLLRRLFRTLHGSMESGLLMRLVAVIVAVMLQCGVSMFLASKL